MILKKAIVATLVVSGMLAALAGPIPASVEAAQEQQQEQQSVSKEVKIDKKLAAKLQKAVKQFAGKEIKLPDVGQMTFDKNAKVESADGKYVVHFDYKNGEIWEVNGKVAIDTISKQDREKILKVLKGAYAKKTYNFDKEAIMKRAYDGKKGKLGEYLSYTLTGKDFEAIYVKNGSIQKGQKDYVNGVTIKFAKEELDPKLLDSAAKAVKTAFDHDFDLAAAYLSSNGQNHTWGLEDKEVSLEIESKSGKVSNIFHETRKKVTTQKEITANEAKEVIAPIAKELFNIDISEYEVKWDNLFKDYCFGKATEVRAALDAGKNVVYIKSGSRAASGN
ncbi:hypothetical protein [Paenibacillus apiarius]|uniref:PepSY domain-containing protein n=1 Tax=Paenibacillus apiarius TaxID=46240 RepID=A0ABT4DTF3_9BACL|nr:hypothetical protein [Paenibacillus apiarius]MCY9517407.1 hypothetical protein [Paenibacillus apiarius]MCY9520630.1 hypothetical protein [Paenibacillus apiarius]MCY9552978.1 hypothetical protein [Paenibacillus apiarius]MCY9561655.1 hypothetical protein [Paenibacillus apiarius]MCY9687060.1 hypothetical protein [Paenibacillus apiarius]